MSIVSADVSHLSAQQRYYQQYYQNQQQQVATAPISQAASSYNGVANSYVPPASGAVGAYARATGAYNQERSQTYLIPPPQESSSTNVQQQYAQTNVRGQSSGSAITQYNAGQTSQTNLALNAYSSGQIQQQSYGKHLEPIVTKHFYVHAAPEDPEDKVEPQYVYVGRPRKNVKVIFIKAPTYSRTPIVPIYPKNEDKTIVYVLSKKPGAQQIDIPEPPPTEPTKPEVFFIKYKNAAEAQAAQEKIQGLFALKLDDIIVMCAVRYCKWIFFWLFCSIYVTAAYENGQLGSSDNIFTQGIQGANNINTVIGQTVGNLASGAQGIAAGTIGQVNNAIATNANTVVG